MNKPFIEIDAEHFTLSAFETKPIEGYTKPFNKETKEQFPNCCNFHKSVFEGAKSWFSNFPNCCNEHRAMAAKSWFNKSNYSGVVEKIIKQLSYTEHHISERINNDDWYKDITDYIDYNVFSFGQPAIGLSIYLGNVKHYIENTNSKITKDKRKRLIEFIETYYNSPKESNKTDLNVLYSTYQKWLKVFPFEISFFANLKPHFEKQLPIIKGKPEVNKYLGTAKAKMHTKSSLIDVLLNITNNLLTQINPYTLYEKGLLTEPEKIKLELIVNEMKIDNKKGYSSEKRNEEQRYRDILHKWFKRQKKFIDEVTPLLKSLPPQYEVLPFHFENNFDKVDKNDVYNYFKTELVISKMLTENELRDFLIAAFQNLSLPDKKFNLKDVQTKDKIMKVFYLYYKNKAGKPHGKQKEYAALLGNYFEGYKTDTVSSNFSKSVY